MASQLSLYQDALMHLGERQLASLSEDREPRRVLDEVYDRGIRTCIEQGFWNWSIRAVEMEPEASIEPSFGFRYAFLKPSDWVRTFTVSDNENLQPPLMHFSDENGYIFADVSPLYVLYVSSSSEFGLNLAAWPESFANYVSLHLARRVCRRLTNSQDMYETLWKLEKMAKADAMSKDAINEGVKRMPVGTWVSSRYYGTQQSRWNRTFS